MPPASVRAPDLSVEERIGRVEDMMSKVLTLLEEMQAHGEHQLVAVQVCVSFFFGGGGMYVCMFGGAKGGM